MAYSNLYSVFLAGFLAGAVLYIPIGPNGILALNQIQSTGYKGIIPTATGSILSCFTITLVGSIFFFLISIDQSQNHFINLSSAIVLIVIGGFFFLSSRLKHTVKKYTFDFKKMFVNAFLIGVSNPKGIIGFPLLMLSFVDLKDFGFPLFQAFAAAMGAVLSSTFWWIIFYHLFKVFNIRKRPFVLKRVIEFLSLVLIGLGVSRLL